MGTASRRQRPRADASARAIEDEAEAIEAEAVEAERSETTESSASGTPTSAGGGLVSHIIWLLAEERRDLEAALWLTRFRDSIDAAIRGDPAALKALAEEIRERWRARRRTPGIDRLYSGVTKSRPRAAWISDFSRVTAFAG